MTRQLINSIHQTHDSCQQKKFLSEIYPKGEKFDSIKTVTNRFGNEVHYDLKKVERLLNCCNTLFFIKTINGKIKLERIFGCNVRFCPFCEWRRTVKLQHQFFQIIPKLHADNPGGSWLLLTLTLRNCEPDQLRDTINLMSTAWHRLKILKQTGIIGFFRTLEITHTEDKNNDNKTAHPHYHVLIHVNQNYFNGQNYISQKRWTELWQRALKIDYPPIVDIRKIKNITDDDIKGALEVLKYSIKSDDLFKSPHWFQIVDKQMRSVRKFATGGTIKAALDKIENEPVVLDDEAEFEELQGEYEKFKAHYSTVFKRYVAHIPKDDDKV